MDRRSFLVTLAAGTTGLTGCSAITGRNRTPTHQTQSATPSESPSPSTTPTKTQPGAAPPPDWAAILSSDDLSIYSIIDLETLPRTYSLVPTRYWSNDGAKVQMVFAATATQDHPPRVVASFTNENPFENTFLLDWTPPFGRLGSDHPRPPDRQYSPRYVTYRDTLAFVPTARHQLVDDPPKVTHADDGTWRFKDEGTAGWLPERVRMESGETFYGEYYVAGHPEGAGNGRPTGIYEFSRGQEGDIQINVWDTERPGPYRTSRFQGMSVPQIPRTESLAWYHEADSGTKSFVNPSTEQSELPAAIDFTFINHAKTSTGCGHWNLYKLHQGRWFHLGPYLHTADCRNLLPGGAKTWTIHAFHGVGLEAREASAFGHLGGGRYAAVAGYGHETSSSAALVELIAGQIIIEPTDDITTERSNGTVTVTSPRWKDDQHPLSATVTVTRAERAEHLVIPEQVMTTRSEGKRLTNAIRNTVPFFDESVEKVVFRTDEWIAGSTIGTDTGRPTLRLANQEQAYHFDIGYEDG